MCILVYVGLSRPKNFFPGLKGRQTNAPAKAPVSSLWYSFFRGMWNGSINDLVLSALKVGIKFMFSNSGGFKYGTCSEIKNYIKNEWLSN
jgi:hypothetical protein